MKAFTPILIYFGSLLLPTLCSAQESPLTDDEVPFKIQAFFYEKYKSTEEVEWASFVETDKKMFKVTFISEGLNKTVLYSDRGRISKEITRYRRTEIDPSMKLKAGELFPDAKIDFLRKIVSYKREAKVEKAVYYELVMKQKRTNLSVYFDQERQFIKNSNVANLANN